MSSKRYQYRRKSYAAMPKRGLWVLSGKEILNWINPKYKNMGISTDLQAYIDEARKHHMEGGCTRCTTLEELNKFLDSL